jgi:hypothetical protein
VLGRKHLIGYQERLVEKLCSIPDLGSSCYENITNKVVNDSGLKVQKHTGIEIFSNNSGVGAIKELVSIVRNKKENVEWRLKALESLAIKKHKFVKLLVKEMASSENKLVASKSILFLDYYREDKEVRDYLWGLLAGRDISNDIRLSAAEVLVKNEPEKVMDYLLEL